MYQPLHDMAYCHAATGAVIRKQGLPKTTTLLCVRRKEGEQHITFYNLLDAQMKATMGGMEPWNKLMTLDPNTQPR